MFAYYASVFMIFCRLNFDEQYLFDGGGRGSVGGVILAVQPLGKIPTRVTDNVLHSFYNVVFALTYAFNAPQLIFFSGSFENRYLRHEIFPSYGRY